MLGKTLKTHVTLFDPIVLLVSFCGAAGQCTMCQDEVTSEWTYWDADCGTKIGNKCLSDTGDWMTWDNCCSASGTSGTSSRKRTPPNPHPPIVIPHKPTPQVPHGTDSHGNLFVELEMPGLEWVTQLVHERPDAPPLDPNSIVGLSQVLPAMRSCDCTQVRQTGGCSLNATSGCSERCCTEPNCECSWARSGCGSPDGSRCWDHCCIQSTKACDCSFARAGGCGMQDHGRECWDTCCAAYAQATSVWERAKHKLPASVFSSPLAWSCAVALGMLLLITQRVIVAIGHVTAKAPLKHAAVDAPGEDVRGLLG